MIFLGSVKHDSRKFGLKKTQNETQTKINIVEAKYFLQPNAISKMIESYNESFYVTYLLYMSPITSYSVAPSAVLQQLIAFFVFCLLIGPRGGTSGSTDWTLSDKSSPRWSLKGKKTKGRRDTSF